MRSVRRAVWESGGRLWAHGVAFAIVLILTHELGLDGYGEYVVLLALLAAATLAWNATVLHAVAADMGHGGDQPSWDRYLLRWTMLGAALTTPIAWMVSGPAAAAAIALATAGEAVRVRAVPSMILRGGQRRITVAATAGSLVRLTLVLLLAAAGALSPETALLCQCAAFVTAGAVHGAPARHGSQPHRRRRAELAVEALRWIETYAPALGIAAFLTISTAGGFDLVLKTLAVASELFSTLGVIVVPHMTGSLERVKRALGRAVRAPTLLAMPVALVFALSVGPAVTQFTHAQIDVTVSAAVLATIIVLTPWEAASRAALLALGRPRWLLPVQIAVSTAALTGALLTHRGLLWAAAAIAAGHVVASAIFAIGLAHARVLPDRSTLLSATSAAGDLKASLLALRPIQRTE